MKDLFLTNFSDTSFLDKIKDNLKKCTSFYFSVSFIKMAGLVLIENDIKAALDRGVKGKIITSTYQNFTDIPSLNRFISWIKSYPNFECHLDFECFGESGFHTKGYLFEYDESFEIVVGSSNITRFALLKNQEWDVSLISKDPSISYNSAIGEFNYLWDKTLALNKELIGSYSLRLDYAIEKWDMDYMSPYSSSINPNSMQRRALKEIRRYRDMGVKKALIVSATGSGKTYLAAFDARNFGAKRLLYVVHRDMILKDARETFSKVFGNGMTFGMYTGKQSDLDCDFIFASTSMLSRHLKDFFPDEFDYIVFDEVHHIVADSGMNIINYFKPAFLLGLTATPERMDNKDVFAIFEHNIPFELRLRDAILNDLVVPFHYYGIMSKLTDYGEKDRAKISREIARNENVWFISKEIEKHRPKKEKLRCIAFCTTIAHARDMAFKFGEAGYNAISLTGTNDFGERVVAFNNLQDDNNPLEIICAVDILNEGIDIPKINMVLFLRPTESQTIFLQQLGRGLRKYPGKDYVTVLDFIGNNYDRSVQIALALGTLGRTAYAEKGYLKDLINTDFASLGIPGLMIFFDDLAKEEIIHYIDRTNFNKRDFLRADYKNFKDYLGIKTYPSHMDYLDSDVSPDLMRFIKSKIGTKNKSYYTFLKKIGEETIPNFNEDEVRLLDALEELLPLVREDEYLLIKQIVTEKKASLDKLVGGRITPDTLKHAYGRLATKGIVNNPKVKLENVKGDLKEYILDTLEYGLTRYSIEFGDYEGLYKLYGNYYSEQITMPILKDGVWQKGTYYNVVEKGDTFIFAGLKKNDVGKLNYKDKFISSKVFQWESQNNTTIASPEGIKLQQTKRVFLFVRKMSEEDGIVLPYTYFGTGTFNNMRESETIEKNVKYPTLLFDILLDNQVPKEFFLDFEIPKE